MLRFFDCIFIRVISCALLYVCTFAHAEMELTLEQKVGQLLMVHFNGEELNEEARSLIQKGQIGGVIYYNWANGLTSPSQVQNLSNALQRFAKEHPPHIPLFIATDQEGGVVARLEKGFTLFPGNKVLGLTKKPELTEECAFAMGEEMHAVGINFNLAPVADINSNPLNRWKGMRSFGTTPEEVVLHTAAALKGFKRAGIISCLKHFPGHGDASTDSHFDLPVVNRSKEELRRVELLPFIKLLPEADTVMTGHLLMPSLDPEHCATLSKKILHDLLRLELGYQGVVISDSLVMEGVLKKTSSVSESTIQAFEAGCDILLLGGRLLVGSKQGFELDLNAILTIREDLVNAIKSGRISEERLNASVQKILALKKGKGLFDWPFPTPEKIKLYIKTREHEDLSQKITQAAEKEKA